MEHAAVRCGRHRCRTGRAVRGPAGRPAGRTHRIDHPRRRGRDGRHRRPGAGSGPDPSGTATPRGPSTRRVRHRRRRDRLGLRPAPGPGARRGRRRSARPRPCCPSSRRKGSPSSITPAPPGSSTPTPSKPTTACGCRQTKIILCGGGTNRLLPLPGADLLGSHHDAWSLTSVPESLLVVGAGATGAQVASVFNELGSRVMLYEAAPRILMTEDEDVSRVMAESFRARRHRRPRRLRPHPRVPSHRRRGTDDLRRREGHRVGRSQRRGRRHRLAGRHRRTEPAGRRGRNHPPGLHRRRLPTPHQRAAHLRRGRHHRPAHVGPPSRAGRVPRRHQRRPRTAS